jgi:hypothetical protein
MYYIIFILFLLSIRPQTLLLRFSFKVTGCFRRLATAYTLLFFYVFFPLYRLRLISSIDSDNQSSDVFQVEVMVFINAIVISWKTPEHWPSEVAILSLVLPVSLLFLKFWH